MFKSFNLVWAKKETVYGTDPVPVYSANGILTGPVDIEPSYRKLDRLNVKSFLGSRPMLNIGEYVKVSFETELRGSGTAGTAPEIGVLFEGCGMAHTNTPATSDVYVPDDDIDGSSITLYVQQHDHKYIVTGCRGTWSLDGPAGVYPKVKWEFTGLYADPTDNAIPTNTTYAATVPPIVKAATFSLGSFDTEAIIGNFKLVYGNEIAKRPSVNATTGYLAHYIKERKVTAQIDPEAVALSVFNPIASMQANTEYVMGIVFGSAAGNILTIAAPKVTLSSAKYGERENILTWDGGLDVNPDAGEDDVELTWT
jgi:hypothetical protein